MFYNIHWNRGSDPTESNEGNGGLDNDRNEEYHRDDGGGHSWINHSGRDGSRDLEISEIGDCDEDSGVAGFLTDRGATGDYRDLKSDMRHDVYKTFATKNHTGK